MCRCCGEKCNKCFKLIMTRPWSLATVRFLTVISINLSVLVIGCVVIGNDLPYYGQIISQEISNWDKGAITDVTVLNLSPTG